MLLWTRLNEGVNTAVSINVHIFCYSQLKNSGEQSISKVALNLDTKLSMTDFVCVRVDAMNSFKCDRVVEFVPRSLKGTEPGAHHLVLLMDIQNRA